MSAAKSGRAGDMLGKLTRASGPPPSPEAEPSRDAVTPRQRDTTKPTTPVVRATVRVWHDDEAAAWDELRRRLRRELGRSVPVAELARAAIGTAAEEEAVFGRLLEAIRSGRYDARDTGGAA